METHNPTPDLRKIVQRIGAGDVYDGGRRAIVPGPGHSKHDRGLSLRLSEDNSRIVWHSFNGDPAERVWSYLGIDTQFRGPQLTPAQMAKEREQRQRLEQAEKERKLAFCRRVWSETTAGHTSPVETYLRSRGYLGAIPEVIRYHPNAPMAYPTEEAPRPATHPAMVALVVDAKGGGLGLHVTAIKPDGSGKAMGDRSRRMYGKVVGGAIRLDPFPAGGELAVAEGIETALAYRTLTGTPAWAAMSTAGMSGLIVPPGLGRLVVAADGDEAGIKAARDLAQHASRTVTVEIVPAPEGQDWADVLKEGGQ